MLCWRYTHIERVRLQVPGAVLGVSAGHVGVSLARTGSSPPNRSGSICGNDLPSRGGIAVPSAPPRSLETTASETGRCTAGHCRSPVIREFARIGPQSAPYSSVEKAEYWSVVWGESSCPLRASCFGLTTSSEKPLQSYHPCRNRRALLRSRLGGTGHRRLAFLRRHLQAGRLPHESGQADRAWSQPCR